MRILKAAAVYFALTFAAGFALGILRTLWLAPRFGERAGELLEMPVMLMVIVFVARWVVRRFSLLAGPGSRLGMGFAALGLLLLAELAGVLWLRGLTLSEYLRERDPVSGTAYMVMLVLFAVMPLMVGRR